MENELDKIKSVEFEFKDPETGIIAQEIGTIDLSGLNMSYSIGAQGSTYSTITTSAGANGTSGQYYTSGMNVANWSSFNIGSAASSVTSNSNATLDVKGDATFDGDIKWKGRSLGKLLETIEDRLAILTPDPAKLEKYEALKKAYDHYKLMEKLIGDDDGS